MENERKLTYEEYKEEVWLPRHQSSLPKQKEVSSRGMWAGIGLWIVILLATAVLSGAHSVPTVAETIPVKSIITAEWVDRVATLGFIMLEATIFAAAIYRTHSHYAKASLILSLIAAILANEYSAITKVVGVTVSQIEGWAWFKLAVAFIVGLAAPLSAYFAGEMVGGLFRKHEKDKRQNEENYNQAWVDLDAKINSAFTRYENDYDRKHGALVEPDTPKEDYSQAVIDLARRLVNDQNTGMSINQVMKEYEIKSRGNAAKALKLARG